MPSSLVSPSLRFPAYNVFKIPLPVLSVTRVGSLLPRHPYCNDFTGFQYQKRIDYKIAVLSSKALHSGKPSYLSDLLIPYCPSRTLRSSSSNLLVIPDIRSSTGRLSFAYYAPSLWNSLPDTLRNTSVLSTFCKGLKTYLFPL